MKFNKTVLGLAVVLVVTPSWGHGVMGSWRASIQYGLEDNQRQARIEY